MERAGVFGLTLVEFQFSPFFQIADHLFGRYRAIAIKIVFAKLGDTLAGRQPLIAVDLVELIFIEIFEPLGHQLAKVIRPLVFLAALLTAHPIRKGN